MSDYVQELSKKLEAARKRVRQGVEVKQLKASAPTLFEIIDDEISLAVNRMTSPTPLSYEEYLSAHGEVLGIRRIRNLLNSKEIEEVSASEEVRVIEGQLKQFSDDKKTS
jgi:hypothetical protein